MGFGGWDALDSLDRDVTKEEGDPCCTENLSVALGYQKGHCVVLVTEP